MTEATPDYRMSDGARDGAGAALVRAVDRTCEDVAERGFAVTPRFVSRRLVAALAGELRRRAAAGAFRPAGIGRGANRVERNDIRGDRISWLDAHALSAPERSLWNALEGLRSALNARMFLGLFSLEAHYAVYPPGAFYARHLDRFRDDGARVLSWVLYLNEHWSPDDGGALRIHVGESDAHDVRPEGGTLACFIADGFEHEVLPAKRERLSIAGWFRRRGPW
jgi:SM-20-related protein